MLVSVVPYVNRKIMCAKDLGLHLERSSRKICRIEIMAFGHLLSAVLDLGLLGYMFSKVTFSLIWTLDSRALENETLTQI